MAVASNTQSIQESKAMTPCFIHTPNMTNKWNDFKPTSSTCEMMSNDDGGNNNQHKHINH